MEKFFLHRIQKENGNYSKGIEIHDTMDAAILSYWGRAKLAYGKNPSITFMYLKITDGSGNVVAREGRQYRMAWAAESEKTNKFFLHHIRLEGETFSKDIDQPMDAIGPAYAEFASQMEYGYGNPRHADVSYVCCCITDMLSGGMDLDAGCWEKAVEPEPEPAAE